MAAKRPLKSVRERIAPSSIRSRDGSARRSGDRVTMAMVRAGGVHLVEDLRISLPVFVSRFPVGSSARMRLDS